MGVEGPGRSVDSQQLREIDWRQTMQGTEGQEDDFAIHPETDRQPVQLL